ncbi:hypothetical protein A3F65_01680 [Candidatus Saccharibacteria bacterium RIFCSPHIGHO2_12_FULL_47_16b]|nr:MAG: hypothetical protein A3F65_01680 [Candidatus Saccharibacteria bacterium RIFCSPHIGHO2_12_FULL_47_16b]
MYNETKITEPITVFTDLNAWKEGHRLVLAIYLATKTLPARESYALLDQMRRAVTSVTSNIAEGFSRRGSKEKIQFYSMALGSLTELQNQILIATDVNYLDADSAKALSEQSVIVHKLINGLIKATKSLIPNP